jgi:hypothetical protein
MKSGRPISANALRGQPGLSRAACDRLVAVQPMTVLKALTCFIRECTVLDGQVRAIEAKMLVAA